MLKNRIIPCLDVKNGRVVKGINFVDLKDAGDPVEQAKIYDEQGADELCFLDITASNENRNIILDTVKKTAENSKAIQMDLLNDNLRPDKKIKVVKATPPKKTR